MLYNQICNSIKNGEGSSFRKLIKLPTIKRGIAQVSRRISSQCKIHYMVVASETTHQLWEIIMSDYPKEGLSTKKDAEAFLLGRRLVGRVKESLFKGELNLIKRTKADGKIRLNSIDSLPMKKLCPLASAT